MITDWIKGLFGAKREAPVHDGAPKFGGTFIVAKGPPRCGKTDTATRLAVEACLTYGLPLLAQDVSGDVQKKLDGWTLDAEATEDKEFLEFVSSSRKCKLYSGKDSNKILDAVDSLVGNGKPSQDWQAICLFDEAAIIRKVNPMFFESIAPLFGNAGILAYCTEHREFGIPPAARVCIRRYLLWQDNDAETVVFDRKIPREKLSKPRSDEITIYDPSTGDIVKWDRSRHSPPLELITPAALTTPVREPYRTWSE